MSIIGNNILLLKKELPSTVELVAVSKFKSEEEILEAYEAGQRVFGENRPQELAQKAKSLPSDIEWHFIGHLQTNKIKMTVPYCSLIQSVDSEKLLFEIERYCEREGYSTEVLLEMYVASEETKQGFSMEEVIELLARLNESGELRHICIRGIMGMASFTDDEDMIRAEFGKLMSVFNEIKALGYPFLNRFDIRSFGMTHDYGMAVDMGSNMVRIGTKIFGPRGTRL